MILTSVSPRLIFRHAAGWIAVIFLIVTMVLGAITWVLSENARLLATEGIETTGTVIGREETRRRTDSGSYRYSYYLRIRFQTTDGTPVETRMQVPQSRYDATATGQPATLRYAESEPSVTEFEAGDTARMAFWLTVAGAASLFASLWSGTVALRAFRSLQRAVEGPRREARVVALHRVGKARAETYSMEWNDGTTSGRTNARPRDQLPAVGSTVNILFDPRSGRGWWEGEY